MITSGESMSAPTSDPGKNAVYAMKNGAVRVSRVLRVISRMNLATKLWSASATEPNGIGLMEWIRQTHLMIDLLEFSVLDMEWRITFSSCGKVKEFYWLEI